MSGYEGRMIDRANYSNDTLNTYGYLSAYFIDMYYNHLYSEAITLHTKKVVASITSGYKCTLDAFIKGLDTPELYKNCIQGIHQSFLQHGYPSLSFTHCINKIVNEFIPQDYFKIMSFDDKSQILRKIICDSNKKMILHIVKPPSTLLKDIIDNHTDIENINILQDQYIDILIMVREQLYQQFVEINTGAAVDNQMVFAMQKEIKLLYNEKHDLDKEILKLKQDIIDHKKLVLRLKKQCNDKDNYIAELEAQSSSLNYINKEMSDNKTSLHIDSTSQNESKVDTRLQIKERTQSRVKSLYATTPDSESNKTTRGGSDKITSQHSSISRVESDNNHMNRKNNINKTSQIESDDDDIDNTSQVESDDDIDVPSKELNNDNQSEISQESEVDLFLIDD